MYKIQICKLCKGRGELPYRHPDSKIEPRWDLGDGYVICPKCHGPGVLSIKY